MYDTYIQYIQEIRAVKIKPEIKERIINAANTLTAEGVENPTNDQVREKMGGGSLTHISPVMREWRESKKAEVVAALEMPAELKKIIESSIGQVWTAASKLASATVESFRLAAQESIETATVERDEALSEITRLESKMFDLEKQIALKESEINQVKSEEEKARSLNLSLSTENAALNARVDDRDIQIQNLQEEVKDARKDNKDLQAELIEIAKKTKSKK